MYDLAHAEARSDAEARSTANLDLDLAAATNGRVRIVDDFEDGYLVFADRGEGRPGASDYADAVEADSYYLNHENDVPTPVVVHEVPGREELLILAYADDGRPIAKGDAEFLASEYPLVELDLVC